MKFTTPCFIRKNTPELRIALENLGYTRRYIDEHPKYIFANIDGTYDTDYYCQHNQPGIDTGTNEALFLALAALREDTDEGQWLVFTELFLADCHVFHSGDIIHYDEVEKMFTAFEQPMYVRKATPAELIEHFTKNNE